MARRVSRTFTEVELELMQVIWKAGEVTTDDIVDILAQQGRPLKDGSVRKMLSIMERKGHVTRRPRGRGKAFLYKAKIAQNQAHKSMLLDLWERAFGGSAALMVATLLETRAVNHKEMEKIERLIAKRDKEKQR